MHIQVLTDCAVLPKQDEVIVEEPLEVFVDGVPMYLTMRMPGMEKELAAGYLFAQGVIGGNDDFVSIVYSGDDNRVDVLLANSVPKRSEGGIESWCHPATSSSGLCGRRISDLAKGIGKQRTNKVEVSLACVTSLLDTLLENQEVFFRTGGTHAAAVFDNRGSLMFIAEDIGRHNALDKMVGMLLLSGRLGSEAIIMTSSRLSYEMVLRACRTSCEVLIGISAPSTLGVDLARSAGLTLMGFVKPQGANVYSGTERIADGAL